MTTTNTGNVDDVTEAPHVTVAANQAAELLSTLNRLEAEVYARSVPIVLRSRFSPVRQKT